MSEREKDEPNDRFGWHSGEAEVKLVPGVAQLPDPPLKEEDEPKKEEDER